MDLLCQEMRDAYRAQSRWVLLCSQCREDSLAEWEGRDPGKSTVTAKASLSPWTGCDRKQKKVSEEDLRVSSFEARFLF